jgi:hypothetical protein
MILERGKKKCDCGKIAQWLYMPGYGDNSNPYICDDCVTSPNEIGCSCNWHYGKPQDGLPTDEPEGIEGKDWRWIEYEGDEYVNKITKEEDGYWQYIDEKGRPYPCAEYDYSEDGYPNYTWLGRKLSDLDMWFFFLKRKIKNWWKKNIVDDVPKSLEDIF